MESPRTRSRYARSVIGSTRPPSLGPQDPSRFVVALAELGAPLEAEEEALAEILSVSPYDVRTRAMGTLPKIVHQAPTQEEADRVAAALRARRHGALSFDALEVVSLDRMVGLRRFVVEGDRIYANDRREPWCRAGDVTAIARLVLHQHFQRTQREVRYRYTNRGALRTEVDKNSGESHAEDALVLFLESGPPWLLKAREARFLALGAHIRPTVRENFFATVEWFRSLAPQAVFDERFVASPLVSARVVEVRGPGDPALRADRAADLRVHALGAWLGRDRLGPYRAASRRE